MPSGRPANAAVYAAIGGAVVMIAHHVAAKSVRDAMFLSSFGITALPVMMIVASLFSIAVVVLASRVMTRLTPARLIPASFGASAAFYLGIWALPAEASRETAVVVYLVVVGVGSLLTSGFWSLINERFDPHSAKKYFGWITAGGTVGGILGGLLAERVGATMSVSAMMPILAGFHAVCALLARQLRPLDGPGAEPGAPARIPAGADAERPRSVFHVLKEAPYLRTLAMLVLLGTISAAIIDYVFKAQAVAAVGQGEALLRFFGVFYGGVGVLTFILQTLVSRIALQKMGLARTLGTLPFTVVLGGLVAMVAPGLATAAGARAAEAVFRGSLFRTGYELFYTPMLEREKRAAKPVVDVGFDRLGDAVGGGIIRLVLALGPAVASQMILTVAVLLALAALGVAARLQKAYVGVLEKNLLYRGEGLELSGFAGSILSSGTMAVVPALSPSTELPATPGSDERSDPLARKLADLRSNDSVRVLAVLHEAPKLDPLLVPQAIGLLGSDAVYPEVIRALRRIADSHAGQFVDALVDASQGFSIRRRIPRVLSCCTTRRAVDGLLAGLQDRRFEVRFQCGRALAAVYAGDSGIRIEAGTVYAAVRDEAAAGRLVWESHRLLDTPEDQDASPFVDDFLRQRTTRSMEHVFTLLSLVLPTEPLKVAFHGLHTDDAHLRGTALEYLESVLPPDIREKLWPYLTADQRSKQRGDRSREDVIKELMQSNESIILNLEELRKKGTS